MATKLKITKKIQQLIIKTTKIYSPKLTHEGNTQKSRVGVSEEHVYKKLQTEGRSSRSQRVVVFYSAVESNHS